MEANKPYPPYSPVPCVFSYRASLDVPRILAQTVARLLPAHRTRIGTRRGRRSMGCFAQAVLLRFMRQRATVADLTRDNTISLSSAYRYLHEALDVLAAQAPDLPEVVAEAVRRGTERLLLGGTLIATDRVRDRNGRRDRWYSQKQRHHGGLVQVVTDADGRPLWGSPVEPGCTHDLTVACMHPLPLLYVAAGHGVSTLADKGGQLLERSTWGWNPYVNAERAFVEHSIAHLETRRRALHHVSLCPWAPRRWSP
ncbi:transposase family protein [Kineococcus sp. SYSU DK005]|uniref:transposase family protein n=1 Tax=Kineococcus sp. SYSU DK005 TaxID=3383126 RepID=UPI003D7D7A50